MAIQSQNSKLTSRISVISVNLLVMSANLPVKPTRKNPRSKGAMGPGLQGSFLTGTDPIWRNYWWTIGGTIRETMRLRFHHLEGSTMETMRLWDYQFHHLEGRLWDYGRPWDHGRLLVETMREEAPGEMKRLPLYDFHRSFPTFLGWYTGSLSQTILATCVDFYYQILGDH